MLNFTSTEVKKFILFDVFDQNLYRNISDMKDIFVAVMLLVCNLQITETDLRQFSYILSGVHDFYSEFRGKIRR